MGLIFFLDWRYPKWFQYFVSKNSSIFLMFPNWKYLLRKIICPFYCANIYQFFRSTCSTSWLHFYICTTAYSPPPPPHQPADFSKPSDNTAGWNCNLVPQIMVKIFRRCAPAQTTPQVGIPAQSRRLVGGGSRLLLVFALKILLFRTRKKNFYPAPRRSKLGTTLNNFLIVQNINFEWNYVINMFIFRTHQLETFNRSIFGCWVKTMRTVSLKIHFLHN